jgi:hypothetical protein
VSDFIRRAPAGKVLGRMYLITDDQFNHLVLQENGRAVDGTRLVPPSKRLPASTSSFFRV